MLESAINGNSLTLENDSLFGKQMRLKNYVQLGKPEHLDVKGGAHACCVDLSGIDAASTVHMGPALNGNSALQCFERG